MSFHRLPILVLVFPFVLSSLQSVGADNLIRDGDFECDFATIKDIQHSWTIWGVKEGKIWSNFVRDEHNPHSGKACLRVFRPAHGNAWFSVLANSPNRNQIRPQRGMRYIVSFWARTDRPGESVVRVGSYKRVNPYVDGPSIKTFTFSADKGWAKFSFVFTDGIDFFADEAKHVYLGFFPAGSAKGRNQPKHLWLDDISVEEQQGAEIVQGLVNPATIEIPPLPLRLQQGDTIHVTINAAKTLHDTNLLCGGVSMMSLHRWCRTPYSGAGEYNLHPALEQGFRDLRLPLTRFYGLLEREPFDKVEDALDAMAFFLDRIGVPAGNVMVELEDYHADSVLAPETWAHAAAHCLRKGYRIRYWEIGNEVYASIWGSGHGRAFETPDTYIRHVLAVSKAVKEVQPDALIGISIPRSNLQWGNYVLKATAGHYDFVCPHLYGGFGNIESTRFEDIVIVDNHEKITAALELNALLRAYNPDRNTYIYDSEWGLHASASDGKHADWQPKNGNILGAMYRAVRLLYYARENVVHGASSWKSLTRKEAPGFAVLYHDMPETRSMLYWLYFYFNRGLGEKVLDMQGSVPYYTSKAKGTSYPLTPVMATADAARSRIYLMLVNGSWEKDVPACIDLRGFRIGKYEAVLLSHNDINAYPHLKDTSEFVRSLDVSVLDTRIEFTMPAHSIAFIQLEK